MYRAYLLYGLVVLAVFIYAQHRGWSLGNWNTASGGGWHWNWGGSSGGGWGSGRGSWGGGFHK